jgi:glycopeptide antibiotics resistance protein
MTGGRTAVRTYTTAAVLSVAFAAWGSLFPFDFHAVPWSAAAARFLAEWAVPVSRWSMTDLVSNVLLFVPIGLFALAALESRAAVRHGQPTVIAGPPRVRLRAGAIVIGAAIALSGAIEFGQAYVSWRTPSIVDVGAEAVGAACGVVVWCVFAARFDAAVAAAARIVSRSPIGERVLLAYCVIFAAAWLVPADFTLRPNEIADKYVHKRLLLPFMPSPDAASVRDLTAIGAAAVPVGVTATLCGWGGVARRSVWSAALMATAFLAALEVAQVFVFSRTTDATTWVVASGAAAAAAALVAVAGGRPIAAAARWGDVR